jgi:hypothetical protein
VGQDWFFLSLTCLSNFLDIGNLKSWNKLTANCIFLHSDLYWVTVPEIINMEDVCTWWHFKLYACQFSSSHLPCKELKLAHLTFWWARLAAGSIRSFTIVSNHVLVNAYSFSCRRVTLTSCICFLLPLLYWSAGKGNFTLLGTCTSVLLI